MIALLHPGENVALRFLANVLQVIGSLGGFIIESLILCLESDSVDYGFRISCAGLTRVVMINHAVLTMP